MSTKTINEIKLVKPIHPDTHIGHVSLMVAKLDDQINFYQNVLGFHLHWRGEDSAGLGAGSTDLLRLVEKPNIRKYYRVTGLYHFAVLYPSRRELARAIARLFVQKYQNYPTDHIMTKSTYLEDPEGNGIELYTESPEDGEWYMDDDDFYARRADGTLSNGREPLDVEALFSHLESADKLDTLVPKETRIGHVHLHVRDIDEAVDFYHGVIGFDVMGVARTMRAAFVSAGGYHHHLGLNTWQGVGAPHPPPGATGLHYFTILLPDAFELDNVLGRIEQTGISTEEEDGGILVRDPSQNGVLLMAK